MTRIMWAVVNENHVLMVHTGYWAIINSFGCRRAADFYQQNPRLRIKRCKVTVR